MFLKILKTHTEQIKSIEYLFNKEEQDRVNGNKNIVNLSRCWGIDKPEDWINQTKENCEYRYNYVQKQQKKMNWNHNTQQIIVSVHPRDSKKLESAWGEIKDKLMEDLKLDPFDNNVAVWLHKDREHHHLHILFSKIDQHGQKWEKEGNCGWLLNNLRLKYNREYDLESNPSGTKNMSDRNPAKQQLDKELYFSYKESLNFKEFEQKIKEKGIQLIKNNNGTFSYIINVKGKDFRFHQKSLNKKWAADSIQQLNRNEEPALLNHTNQEQITYLNRSLSAVLNRATSFEEFQKTLLEKYNIKTITKENKTGIFGVSFQPTNQQLPITMAGSKLVYTKFSGKQSVFSYKTILFYLNANKKYQNMEAKKTVTQSTQQRNETRQKINFDLLINDSKNQHTNVPSNKSNTTSNKTTGYYSSFFSPSTTSFSSSPNEFIQDEDRKRKRRRKKEEKERDGGMGM